MEGLKHLKKQHAIVDGVVRKAVQRFKGQGDFAALAAGLLKSIGGH